MARQKVTSATIYVDPVNGLDTNDGSQATQGAGNVGSAVNNSQSLRVTENFPPQLGLNYISAMEFASASSTTVTAGGTYAYLQLSLEM